TRARKRSASAMARTRERYSLITTSAECGVRSAEFGGGVRNALRPRNSALRTPHSTLRTPHSALHTPHSTLRTPHSTLRTPNSALHTARSELRLDSDKVIGAR